MQSHAPPRNCHFCQASWHIAANLEKYLKNIRQQKELCNAKRLQTEQLNNPNPNQRYWRGQTRITPSAQAHRKQRPEIDFKHQTSSRVSNTTKLSKQQDGVRHMPKETAASQRNNADRQSTTKANCAKVLVRQQVPTMARAKSPKAHKWE